MSDPTTNGEDTPPGRPGDPVTVEDVDPTAASVGGLPAGDRIDDLAPGADPNDAFRTRDEEVFGAGAG